MRRSLPHFHRPPQIILSLTPRADAAWDENSSLTPVNSGTLSYQFYLSAGALYTFANDPANQTAYGLTPYINPADSSDRGASFGADYATFRDSYTLVNALKNGWYFENGENVFYVDGVLHTTHTAGESIVTAPTCTGAGFTTHVCAVCGVTYVTDGTDPLGHAYTGVVTAPTCTEPGFTTHTCTRCGDSYVDSATEALGHSWNAGVLTQEPTESAPGIKTFTCTVCGETRTEEVEYQAQLKKPSVSMTVSTNASGRIVLTAQVEDYENLEDYCEITAHGILYIPAARIGSRTLTINTSGRTKVSFGGYSADGTYTYNLKPTTKTTTYAFRAYITYTDPETGRSVTVYSAMFRGSYNTLNG